MLSRARRLRRVAVARVILAAAPCTLSGASERSPSTRISTPSRSARPCSLWEEIGVRDSISKAGHRYAINALRPGGGKEGGSISKVAR